MALSKTFIIPRLLTAHPSAMIPVRKIVDLVYKKYEPKVFEPSKVPIFIYHGLLGSKKNWASISRKLAHEHRTTVYAVDARNHGESPWHHSHTYIDMADDLRQLIHKLSYPEVNLIGHSMGGRACMVLALVKPHLVASVMAVDISTKSLKPITGDFFPLLLNTLCSITFEDCSSLLEAKNKARKKIAGTGLMDEKEAEFLLMNIVRRKNGTIDWQINFADINSNLEDIYEFPVGLETFKYDKPMLCVAGKSSLFVPKGEINNLRHYFPKAEVVYIPRAGHCVHIDQPDTFMKLTQRFYSQLLLK